MTNAHYLGSDLYKPSNFLSLPLADPDVFVCYSVCSVCPSVLSSRTARPGRNRQPTHTKVTLGALPCTVTFLDHLTWPALFAHLYIHTLAHSGSLAWGFFFFFLFYLYLLIALALSPVVSVGSLVRVLKVVGSRLILTYSPY